MTNMLNRPLFGVTMPIAIVAACALLAGCGGGGDDEDALSAPTASVESISVPPAPPVAGDSGSATEATEATDGAASGPTSGALMVRIPKDMSIGSQIVPGLGIEVNRLLALASDWGMLHDAAPMGVPAGYDWARKARLGAGNKVPSGFNAITGWGQSFWAAGTTGPSARLQVRNHQLLVCHGADRRWTRLQSGDIEGATFNPDYVGNITKQTLSFSQTAGVATIRFDKGMAYHFWPKAGRAALPTDGLCGVLVLLDARAVPEPGFVATTGLESDLLIGLGGDYWLSKSAAWDNYKTNKDVGVGRLRTVGLGWRTYGLTTATAADLNNLVTTSLAGSLVR